MNFSKGTVKFELVFSNIVEVDMNDVRISASDSVVKPRDGYVLKETPTLLIDEIKCMHVDPDHSAVFAADYPDVLTCHELPGRYRNAQKGTSTVSWCSL